MTDYDLGGTVRLRPVNDTLDVIQPYIKKAGITRIANLTPLDTLGIPVYTCFRPNSRNLATSQGKGINDQLAMCSAYMEAIEHYFSEWIQVDIPHYRPTRHDRQFLPAKRFPEGMFHIVKRAYPAMDWTALEAYPSGEAIYIPSSLIHFNLEHANLADGLFKKTTTGLASGNNKMEATLHGLYEVIERHSTFCFQKKTPAEKQVYALDLSSIDFPPATHLLKTFADQQVNVAIFMIPNRFDIPVYQCVIADEHPYRGLGHYSGAGCHLNAGIALCRALTEAAQSRLTYIAGSRDDMFPSDYALTWRPLTITGEALFHSTPDHHELTIQQQLDYLVECLAQHQFKLYRYEHTAADDAISVIRTLVPGLTI